MNIAIVQLGNYGDVVLSTSVLRACKQQMPGCKIHYVTSKACAAAISNNPDIDELIQLDIPKSEVIGRFNEVFRDYKSRTCYDIVCTPWAGYVSPVNWRPLEGKVKYRSFMYSIARCIQSLGLKWSPPLVNYIYPTDAEKAKTAEIIESFKLSPGMNVLLEVETLSKQSQLTPKWLPEIFSAICNKWGKDTSFWISIGKDPEYLEELQNKFNVFSLSAASIISVAMATDYCDAFLSVSSGTSNACHHQHRSKNVLWLEAVNNMDWATTPYGTENKHVYLGKTVSGYISLINKVM